MAQSGGTQREYHCSFCGKAPQEVRRLIAGPGTARICDECVELCREIMVEETAPPPPQPQPPIGGSVERLWTPWRLAFIEAAAKAAPPTGVEQTGPWKTRTAHPECFLCAKPADAVEHDRENLVVYRAERAYVLLNLYPYNPGHLMVAPYIHTGALGKLATEDVAALFLLMRQAVTLLDAVYQPEGFNVGMNLGRTAGAGLPDHLHVHVVPRWTGDTNFMPIIGNTKLLPETLEQTYDRLRPYFATAPSTSYA